MYHNKLIAFFSLFFIGLVYLFCVFIVWITRGKYLFFIKKKVSIGVQVLVVASVLSLLSCESCIAPPVLCYKPAPPTYVSFTNTNDESHILVQAEGDRRITGVILEKLAEEYVFQIEDNTGEILQEGNVQPKDGKFDNDQEEIQLTISKELLPGTYILVISASQPDGNDFRVYRNFITINPGS